MTPATRRKRARGDWAKLRDSGLLANWMTEKDMTQARLARYAECSRQFINQLVHGEKDTCTPFIATRIEEGLGVVPGTLFERMKSCDTGQSSGASRRAA